MTFRDTVLEEKEKISISLELGSLMYDEIEYLAKHFIDIENYEGLEGLRLAVDEYKLKLDKNGI